MRYQEIKTLLEYDRSTTAQKLGPKLIGAVQQDQSFYNRIRTLSEPEQLNAVLEQLESMDPTPNRQYVVWLVRQYVAGQIQLTDGKTVLKTLTQFGERDIRRDFKRRGLSFDINQYSFEQLRDEIKTSTGGIEARAETPALNFQYADEMKVLYNGELGKLIIPRTEDASCELGAGTEWCTAWTGRRREKNQFENYTKDGPLFVWIEPDGTRYQFHFENAQFMDIRDKPIKPAILRDWRNNHPILSKLFQSRERFINPEWPKRAIIYARYVSQGRLPSAEANILKDVMSAVMYARWVIKKRWPELEPLILNEKYTAAQYAYQYARTVLKARWPEAEELILNSDYAMEYARNVIRGRWPELEKRVIKSPNKAAAYAMNVLKSRWPEAEPIIKKAFYLLLQNYEEMFNVQL
jgi:hypothetical protein